MHTRPIIPTHCTKFPKPQPDPINAGGKSYCSEDNDGDYARRELEPTTFTQERDTCTPSSHEALKSRPETWEALPYKGRQVLYGGDLELRNCPRCLSTLAIELPVMLGGPA